MHFWYTTKLSWQAILLIPLSILVWVISSVKYHRRSQTPYDVPLVVIGNVTVGGTGKTPMILWLINACLKHGIRVGVVSRGYGAQVKTDYPLSVNSDVSSAQCGDEPKLIQSKFNIPVVVDPKRDRAVKHLISQYAVDLVISDDGLQHYSMYRNLEIVMLDGLRSLGNGLLLPAGPMRETKSRLNSVDFIVSKQRRADIDVKTDLAMFELEPPKNCFGDIIENKAVSLCSGIGNFNSFRESVESLGFKVVQQTQFKDHEKISDSALNNDKYPIIITEKDAIKLNLTNKPHIYVMSAKFKLSEDFEGRLINKIKEMVDEKSRINSSTL